ncbi:mitofilin family membrane protein [Phyllobacterium sp. LjRoot231]|uniref:COG4223 family protein n=1 Tax=Phyllobacterium sp. LjRoot231 TaxID=3342289 RepID=UPI003ECEA6A6
MAKSSVPRHSKSARKPVTIELVPSSVIETSLKSKNVPEPEPVGFEPMVEAEHKTVEEAQPAISSAPDETQAFGREEFSGDSKPVSASARSNQKANDPLGRLASGFIGGVVALVGAAVLQWAGVLPSPKADTSALEQQIAELRNVPAVTQTLDEGAQVALNGAVENAKQAVGQVSGLSAELNTIKQSVADIQKSAGSASPVDTDAIDARIAALETKLNSSQQQAEQAGGAAAGATERLNALEAKVNDKSDQTNMALAMAATGLKAAIDRGEPFAAELDTYLAVAPAAGDVEILRASATKGIPTVGMLAGQFAEVAPKIIASAHTVDPNAGVVDRLWASATSLVQARPVGMVEGEGVDAITARIEAHLNVGDLGAAVAEWEKLPENAKAVSGDFANAMKARQRAGEVVSKVLSDALTGIKSPATAN